MTSDLTLRFQIPKYLITNCYIKSKAEPNQTEREHTENQEDSITSERERTFIDNPKSN